MSTPEIEGFLLTLRRREEERIREVLLSTLAVTRASADVKKEFEEAIKGVEPRTSC